AEELLHEALPLWRQTLARPFAADSLETLAAVASKHESYQEAARLFGAAEALRDLTGYVRFAVNQRAYESLVSQLRAVGGEDDVNRAWTEGKALSFEEALSYAQRGRGERKRPSVGWASLTPAELDVARLVAEGLANKDIGERLFISSRTVQTHLTHIYTKLDV